MSSKFAIPVIDFLLQFQLVSEIRLAQVFEASPVIRLDWSSRSYNKESQLLQGATKEISRDRSKRLWALTNTKLTLVPARPLSSLLRACPARAGLFHVA